MEPSSTYERLRKLDPGVSCLAATVIFTPLAWISGPIVWGWLLGLLTKETAAFGAALVLVLALWPAARVVARHLLCPELEVMLWWLAVGGIGALLVEYPPVIQVCVLFPCMVPTGRFGLWPWMQGKKEDEYPKPNDEQLRRYPLIRGLMRTVMAGRSEAEGGLPRTRINRIALTGPWGCGKTLVLDHVAYALEQQGKARAVKVNPWGCTTVAEARAVLADGMRTLLGETALQEAPLLKLIPKAFGAGDAVDAVFTQVAGNRKAGLKELDRLLGERVRVTERRMILVIDDMERAGPTVVRALLPLLSELIELHHCTFLIAIDEEHFRRAFAVDVQPQRHTQPSESEVTSDHGGAISEQVTADGFLQKVFELRIKMPTDAPQDRIAAMARMKLGLETPADSLDQPHWHIEPDLIDLNYPKLAAALPILTPYFPPNPRELERFLDKARFYEVCFLTDYLDDERDWVLFFHLWLMDTRFPGFAESIAHNIPSEIMSRALDKKVDDGKRIAATMAARGFRIPEGLWEDFKSAYGAFWKTLGSNFMRVDDLGWYSQGFLSPPALPGLLRRKLYTTWEIYPQKRLHDLAYKAFSGKEAPEMVGLSRDLLKMLVDHPKNALLSVVRGRYNAQSRSDTEASGRGRLQLVKSSVTFWMSSPSDLTLLEQAIELDHIKEWVGLADLVSYWDFVSAWSEDTRTITLGLVECSGMQVLNDFLSDREDFPEMSAQTQTKELTDEIVRRVRERIREDMWDAIILNRLPDLPSGETPALAAKSALLDPEKYFPPGEWEEKLAHALPTPSESLREGLELSWYWVSDKLARTQRLDNTNSLNQRPDYWLMLWHSFESLCPERLQTKIRKALRSATHLPDGLKLVREACSENAE